MTGINKGVRLANFIIDLLVIAITSSVLAAIFNQYLNANIIPYMCYFLYYFTLESINGKTIGKIVTKTVVVDSKTLKPNVYKILLRTILRFYPFDLMSFLFGYEMGAHDSLSRTKLIAYKVQ